VPTPPDAPHFLARLDCALVAQPLQCSDRGNRHGCGLLERDVRRLQRDCAALANHDVLRNGAACAPEHFVARLVLRDVLADGFDRAGEIDADAYIVRRADARRQSHDVRRAAHGVPVDRVEPCGMHFHE
jgi:hypothetical protein